MYRVVSCRDTWAPRSYRGPQATSSASISSVLGRNIKELSSFLASQVRTFKYFTLKHFNHASDMHCLCCDLSYNMKELVFFFPSLNLKSHCTFFPQMTIICSSAMRNFTLSSLTLLAQLEFEP